METKGNKTWVLGVLQRMKFRINMETEAREERWRRRWVRGAGPHVAGP